MSHADFAARNIEPLFYPVSHYDSLDEVHGSLSIDEKGTIISSWASDMYVVESLSAFRDVPSVSQRLWLDDPLAADEGNDPMPPAGLAMSRPRLSKVERTAFGAPQREVGRHAAPRSVQASRPRQHARWTRKENIRRNRKLLSTQLTELERSFIERRLAEELHDCSTNHHYGGNRCLLA